MNNKPLTAKYHKVWDSKVRELSGGLTIFQPAKGQWLNNTGDLVEEEMIPVQIACSREAIAKIAQFTGTYYKQKVIFYYLISSEVHMLGFEKEG